MEGSRVPSVFLEETVREGFFFAYSITHPDSRAPLLQMAPNLFLWAQRYCQKMCESFLVCYRPAIFSIYSSWIRPEGHRTPSCFMGKLWKPNLISWMDVFCRMASKWMDEEGSNKSGEGGTLRKCWSEGRPLSLRDKLPFLYFSATQLKCCKLK